MQMGYIFDQYLDFSRVVNGTTVRCYKQSVPGPWKLVTLIAGVCIQHSSEAYLAVLLCDR